MSNQIKEIAQRLKGLRDLSDFTIEDMAGKLNIDVSQYEAYESGEVDIPVSLLYEAATVFGVELTAVLTGDDPKLRVYSLVKKGKGLDVKRRAQYKYQNLAYNFAHKKAEPFIVTVEPNEDSKDSIALNTHPGQEMNYVIEGTLMVKVGGHELILNEGDTLYYDSSAPHGMKALNDKPVKFLAIIM